MTSPSPWSETPLALADNQPGVSLISYPIYSETVSRLVEDHRHCLNCGKAISRKEHFCSAECEQAFMKNAQRERRRNLIFLVAIGMFISLIFLLQLF